MIGRHIVSASPLDGTGHASPGAECSHRLHESDEIADSMVWEEAYQNVHVICQLCVTKDPHPCLLRSTDQGRPNVRYGRRVDAPNLVPGAPHNVGVHLISSMWSHVAQPTGATPIHGIWFTRDEAGQRSGCT